MTSNDAAAPIPAEIARRFNATVPLFAGTTSVLYEGRDESGKRVLVKVLRDAAFASPAERQRVLREVQKLAQVRHPALAGIVASGEEGGRVWIAREFVEGESLSERLARGGPLPVAEAARIGSYIAAAVGELHRCGVLHRDIRPGHVLLEPSGTVRVIDAGAGRMFRAPDGRLTAGTPGYVSPEAIAGKLVSFRSDLYSLGATLFEMLSGAPPYGTPDTPDVLARQVDTDAPALRVPAPPALAKLIASLLSREPRERPFSAQQLERQLEPLAFAPGEASASRRTAFDDEEDNPTQVGQLPVVPAAAAPAAPAKTPAAPAKREDFDDDEATQIGDSPLSAPKAAAAASPPPNTASFNLPPRVPSVPPPVPASARSASPPLPATRAGVPSAGTPGATTGNVRKATLMGMSPLTEGAAGGPAVPAPLPKSPMGATLAGMAPPMAGSAMAPAPMPPTPMAPAMTGPAAAPPAMSSAAMTPAMTAPAAPPPPAARPPAPASDDLNFDDVLDTMVQEDSRIFGLPEMRRGSPHGTAVPPLPDNVAARVLTGSMKPPPPDAPMASEGRLPGPAVPAPPVPGPTSPGRSVPPPGPGFGPQASPAMPAAPAPGFPPQGLFPNSGAFPQPGYGPPVALAGFGGQSAQGSAGPSMAFASTMPAMSAQHAPQPMQPSAYPPPSQGFGGPPWMQGSGMQPGTQGPGMQPYPTPNTQHPAPGMPYGAPQHGFGAPQQGVLHQVVGPQAGPSMGVAAHPAPRRALWPWLVAGLGVAGIAGGSGYVFATHHFGSAAEAPAGGPEGVALPAPNTVPTPQPVPMANPTVVPTPVPAPAEPPTAAATAPGATAPTPTAPAAAPPAPAPAPAPPAPAEPHDNGSAHAQRTAPSETSPSRASRSEPTATQAHRAPPPAAPAQPVARGDALAQARQALARRDYASARTLLTTAARQQPGNAETHYLLGDTLAHTRDNAGALNELRQAVRIAPRNTQYLRRLAEIQLTANDRGAATGTLRQVLQIEPRNTWAQQQLDQLTRVNARGPATDPQPGRTTPVTATSTRGTTPAITPPPRRTEPFVPAFGAPIRSTATAPRPGTVGR
jgi:serine/threonine-protein kinase